MLPTVFDGPALECDQSILTVPFRSELVGTTHTQEQSYWALPFEGGTLKTFSGPFLIILW